MIHYNTGGSPFRSELAALTRSRLLWKLCHRLSVNTFQNIYKAVKFWKEMLSECPSCWWDVTHFFSEANTTHDWRKKKQKQGTILQTYFFLPLKLAWWKLLSKVICCMLSWEPFSTGALIINHTFPGTNHHALKSFFEEASDESTFCCAVGLNKAQKVQFCNCKHVWLQTAICTGPA